MCFNSEVFPDPRNPPMIVSGKACWLERIAGFCARRRGDVKIEGARTQITFSECVDPDRLRLL
jgi:hypothetical protein